MECTDFLYGDFWTQQGGSTLENLQRPPLHLLATEQILEIWALWPSIDKIGSTKKSPTNKFSRVFSGSYCPSIETIERILDSMFFGEWFAKQCGGSPKILLQAETTKVRLEVNYFGTLGRLDSF